MTITTETETTNLKESYETVERAITARLAEFDAHTTQLHPVVAGWMRRALRKNLARLAQLKNFLEERS